MHSCCVMLMVICNDHDRHSVPNSCSGLGNFTLWSIQNCMVTYSLHAEI